MNNYPDRLLKIMESLSIKEEEINNEIIRFKGSTHKLVWNDFESEPLPFIPANHIDIILMDDFIGNVKKGYVPSWPRILSQVEGYLTVRFCSNCFSFILPGFRPQCNLCAQRFEHEKWLEIYKDLIDFMMERINGQE